MREKIRNYLFAIVVGGMYGYILVKMFQSLTGE